MKTTNKTLQAILDMLELAWIWVVTIAFPAVTDFIRRCGRALPRVVDQVSTGIIRLSCSAIVLYVAIGFFFPEFSEEFPTIYSMVNGLAGFLEFLISWELRALKSLFTLNFIEQVPDLLNEWVELWNQFVNWFMAL